MILFLDQNICRIPPLEGFSRLYNPSNTYFGAFFRCEIEAHGAGDEDWKRHYASGCIKHALGRWNALKHYWIGKYSIIDQWCPSMNY